MMLLAPVLTGLFFALLVGEITGYGPRFEFRKLRRAEKSRSQTWLIQAGVDLNPRQFWMASAAAAVLAFVFFLAITGVPLIAIMPALLVGLLPRAFFARRRSRRDWRSRCSKPRASRAAGTPNKSAPLEKVIREAFGTYPLLARTLGVLPALEVIKEELADPTSDRVIEVLILAYQRGGSIVPRILQDLGEATTRDLWAIEEIRTEALEQKINARVVFALPWFVLVALTARIFDFFFNGF